MNTWLELSSLNFVADTPVVLTESWLEGSLLSCALDKPFWLTWFKPGFFDIISGMFQGEKDSDAPSIALLEGKPIATWHQSLSGPHPES